MIMGAQAVKPIQSPEERIRFLQHLLNDIRALDYLIREDRFEQNKQRVGAEQEMCLIDEDAQPSKYAMEVLGQVGDPHLTSEIALFNLEANLDPYELRSDCLRLTERQLIGLLDKTRATASDFGAKILLTGILPTIRHRHLEPEYMTPLERYFLLSETTHRIRGTDFEINIQGVDELIGRLDD